MTNPETCPVCGLPTASRDEKGEWQPNCNPLRCDAWQTIAVLPKSHSTAARLNRKAEQMPAKGQG